MLLGEYLVKLVEGLLEERAGAGEVQADEGDFACSVHAAGVDHEAGLMQELLGDGVAGLAGGGAVDPCEVGAFEGEDGVLGKVLLEVCGEQGVVAVEVGVEFVEPVFSFPVGGDGGVDGEGVDVANFVDVDGFVDFLPDGLIGGDDVGDLDASEVEGFAGGDAGDGVLPCFFGECGEWCVAVSRLDEFAMDFVGDDEDLMFDADAGDFL